MIKMICTALGSKPKPFSLVHFLTERCNARCRHCFIDFTKPSDPALELTVEEIGHLTRHLGKSLYNVNLTGGEPFLRKDIMAIVRCYLDNTPVRSIVITTNGWFTDDIMHFVRQYESLDTDCALTISVSIDDSEEEHDAGRNLEGLFARALASYRAVAGSTDRRILADIALTVTGRNASRITDIYHELAGAGVTRISPVLLRDEGVTRITTDRETLATAYRKVTELAAKTAAGHGTGLARTVHRAKNRISRKILAGQCRTPRFVTPCKGGTLFASIGAAGGVYPCELLTVQFPLGNLRDYDMNFLKLWHDTPAIAARKYIRRTKCHCTFECAWTVNIVTTPAYWPKMLAQSAREAL